MLRSFRIVLLFVAAVALLALVSEGFAQSPGSGARNRIAGRIDDADVVTVAGNTHPLATAEQDRGAMEAEARLERMVLVLQADQEQQLELDALADAQQEPGSQAYHRWLTPEEYGSRFGVSSADLARIEGWLAGHGFAVEPVSAGHRLIVFSGTAGQVADAFHTEMHRYEVGGKLHVANAQDPQIPKALAPVVAGVLSLHDFRRVSSMRSVRAVANPGYTQASTHYLFPADFAAIYDLNALYAAGTKGAGASIAIVGRSNIDLDDVRSFRSMAGLSTKQPTVLLDGANPGLVAGDQDEATLDVEWSGAVAPAAAVKYVVAATTATTDGVDLSAQYIVNHRTATVMSTSFGSCEADMGTAEMAFYNSLWEQAASEGISAFVSSGDSGAAGCDAGSASKGTMAGVNGLCSSPYATCVGGTEFSEGNGSYWGSTNGAGNGSASGYIPERVWNESGSDGGAGLWASGGGMSGTYAQPSWQKGVSGAVSDGMRAVPDVALTAASHDGYLVCENGSWYIFAGTSAASPTFAGIVSLVVEERGGVGQGNANPALYGLLGTGGNPFHATPTGNNSVPGLHGFTASGAAYNLATGLGSVDGDLLVKSWPVAGSGNTHKGFALKPSVGAVTLVAGKSARFTLSLAVSGDFGNSVTLKAATVAGVSVAFSPASIQPGTTSLVVVRVAGAAAAGASKLVLTGTSAGTSLGTTATASVGLTVLAAPKHSRRVD